MNPRHEEINSINGGVSLRGLNGVDIVLYRVYVIRGAIAQTCLVVGTTWGTPNLQLVTARRKKSVNNGVHGYIKG